MKIAIPLCRQRIAPLFEVAETFLLLQSGMAEEKSSVWQVGHLCVDEKCQHLFNVGVRLLICGAVSRRWQSVLECAGIEVHAFLAGDVQDVLLAYQQEGIVALPRYAMPGRNRFGAGHRLRRRFCHSLSGAFHQFNKE